MDLNALYFHHQIALSNAASGSSHDDRETYFDLARYYARRIRDTREAMGRDFPGWRGLLLSPEALAAASVPTVPTNA